MRRLIILSTFLLLAVSFGGFVYAQTTEQDPNPFTGGQVHNENNPQTEVNTYQQDQGNVHSDPNVNTSNDVNSDSNVNNEYDVNNDTNVNDQYDAYNHQGDAALDQYLNEDTNLNTDYNTLIDPNALDAYYVNTDYTVNDEYNPFWGIGHDSYNPWQQGVFTGDFQSWTGLYFQGNGTNFTPSSTELFSSKDATKQKQFKFTPTDIFNVGASSPTNNSCKSTFKTFGDIIYYIVCIINTFLLQLALTLGVIYFAWGVSQYIAAAGNVEERKKARQIILYGFLVIFCIVCVWGIVKVFKVAFGL